MALKDDIKLGFERVTQLIKAVNTKIGDLTTLTTSAKTDVVAAINALDKEHDDRTQGLADTVLAMGIREVALTGRVTTLEGALGTMDFVAAINAEWAK